MSPFAEKARLMLGYKRLEWAGVTIPMVMPKPDLTALTGGYRRTPVLQIGADVYCDTALIARVLEARQPSPPLFPGGAPLAGIVAQWIDTTLFWTMIAYVMQPAGMAHLFTGSTPDQMKAFAIDRAPFSAGVPRLKPTDAAVQLATALAAFEAQLADGRAWLFGAETSIADFSLAHNLWFVRRAGPLAQIIDRHARLADWHARVLAFGHGTTHELAGSAAVAVAAAAARHAPVAVEHGLGFEAGQDVKVAPVDWGTDPAEGTLVGLSAAEVVIRRQDERAGQVHVHFPRQGFRVSKAEKE
jgi:glutathione S-transferase